MTDMYCDTCDLRVPDAPYCTNCGKDLPLPGTTAGRLEYLRSQIRAESISTGELVELQSLADQIEPGDVELLEWAGVPEFEEE